MITTPTSLDSPQAERTGGQGLICTASPLVLQLGAHFIKTISCIQFMWTNQKNQPHFCARASHETHMCMLARGQATDDVPPSMSKQESSAKRHTARRRSSGVHSVGSELCTSGPTIANNSPGPAVRNSTACGRSWLPRPRLSDLKERTRDHLQR